VVATAKTGISGVIPDGQIVSGIPAYAHRSWKRVVGMLTRLPEIVKRLRALERRMGTERPPPGRTDGDEEP
jgi:UDP-3-O-[3-hydroxymyristoyl] glucosamine N-acyltransferase